MARRKVKPTLAGVINVGIDIGYGYTKAVADISDSDLRAMGLKSPVVVFPSVWGAARDIKFMVDEIKHKYPGDYIEDYVGKFFVGDLALSQLRPHEQRVLRGRTADEETLGNVARARLARVALGKLFPGMKDGDAIHVRLATGLPVDHMHGANELKQSLIGEHLILTDQTHFVVNITEVMVMPQPYGTIYRNFLTDTGDINPCHTYDRTGVIDIGMFSIDATVDDDGEYIDAQSGSMEAGVYIVHERLSQAFERKTNEKPSQRDLDTILRKACIRISGNDVRFDQEKAEAVQTLVAGTLNLMSNLWQTGARVDVIYVAGGGAGLCFREINDAYPQSKLVDDPQMSNAQGYLNYALSTLLD